MRTCGSCGGVLGRDCFDPQECAFITQQMVKEYDQQINSPPAISEHHAKCIEALQRIALLGDAGSNEHQSEYAGCYSKGIQPAGWRVAEHMREVANDVVGNIALSPIFNESKTEAK